VSVDNRLVEYWRRQLADRRRLRVAPAPPGPPQPGSEAPPDPEKQRDDRAGEPADAGVPSNVVPMAFEDR
jgi:hypothetical protein